MPLVLLTLVFAAFHPALELGFLGHDAYPLIASSILRSPGDLPGLFTRKLMAGRYHTDFYRPLVSLSVALDHSLWGMEPFGYQLSTLLYLAACSVALFAFVRRLAGPGAPSAPWLAALVFLLHPVQYEVVPALSRRSEILCATFFLLSLHSLLSPRRMASRRPAILPAFLGLMAIWSKETGLFVLPLAFLLLCLRSPRTGFRARGGHATLASAPLALALGAALLVRFLVLGGPGGYGDSGLDRIPTWTDIAVFMVYPETIMLEDPRARGLSAAIGVALALTALARWSRSRPGSGAAGTARESRHLAAGTFAVSWIVSMLLLHGFAGKGHAWYTFFPSIGWAMLTGILLDGLVGTARRRTAMTLRIPAGASAALLAALLAWQARYSPLFTDYEEWDQGNAVLAQFLDSTARQLREASTGTIVAVGPFPRHYKIGRARWIQGDARIRSAYLVEAYSLQAWADLAFPHRKIRVLVGRAAVPGRDEVVLLVPGGIEKSTGPGSALR